MLDFAADEGPVRKFTVAISRAAPASVAVTVSIAATVDFSVVANTPAALVTPDTAPNTSPELLLDSITAVFGTALPCASFTVTVSVAAVTPSAVRDAGLATMLDFVAEGPPATIVTAAVS